VISSVILFFVILCLFFKKGLNVIRPLRNPRVEWSWTLTPFFVVCVILLPIFFSLSMLEFSSDFSFFGYRRQWFWSLDSRDIYWLRFNTTNIFSGSFLNLTALITSEDVIHDLGCPSLYFKLDACPGRINRATRLIVTQGLNYRTCSELCGVNHSYIPFLLF